MTVEKLKPDFDLVPDQKNIEIYSILEDPKGLLITLRNMQTDEKYALRFETYEYFQNVSNELTYSLRWDNSQIIPYHSLYWVMNSKLLTWLNESSGGGLMLTDEIRGPLKHLVVMTIEKCCDVVFYGDICIEKVN